MPQAFYILFGSLFTAAVSYALGRLLLARYPFRLYRQEQALFAGLAGAALLHLLVFLMLAASIAYKGVFLGLGLAILLWAAWRRLLALSAPPHPEPLSRFWRFAFGIVYVAYAVLYLANAMAPEMSPDGSSYHLGLVGRYLRQRSFGGITTNMYANLSQGIEMLYAHAYVFGRHSAASLAHGLFTLASPWLLLSYGRRLGQPAAGVGAALLFYCSPVVGIDGTTAYIDVAVATVVFSVFYLLEIWREQREANLIPVIGLLAGYCFAVKYTTALAIPFAAGYLFWRLRGDRQPWLRPLARFSLAASLMVVPWMAKNTLTIGNPLSPFLNRLFPNEHIYVSFEEEYVQHMRHYGDVQDYRILPMDLTVSGERLSGILGPVFLLAPLALLSLRSASGRRLLTAALVMALPYATNIGTRFLLPALPMLSLALALTLARSPGILPLVLAAHAFLSWPHVLRTYTSPYCWRLEHIPIAAALRLSPEEQYLAEHSHGWPVARMIEDTVPRGERVFTFTGVAEAYTTREILVSYQSATGNDMGEFLWSAMYPEYGPVHHLRFVFPEQTLRGLRLVAPEPAGEWTAHEIRVRLRGAETPRQQHWRIRAWPNPWRAPYILDNNPVTRWRTRHARLAGTRIELDFGPHPVTATEVVLETGVDFTTPPLILEGQRPDGVWILLNREAVRENVPPLKGLRGAAMDQLRAMGIRYLLVAPGDPGDEDYKANSRLWGITWVGERAGQRLYRIEEERK